MYNLQICFIGVPIKIVKPRIPEYCGGMLTTDASIDTAASVKKKFQCTPYSPVWTYMKKE